MFPHSKRILEIPLTEKAEGENVPVEVSMQFQKFKIEQKLQRARTGEAVTAAVATPPGFLGGECADASLNDRIP